MRTQEIEKLKHEFGDQEFTGNDMERVLELKSFHSTGWRTKWLTRRDIIHKTAHGYRFGPPPESPISAPDQQPPAAPPAVPIETSELVSSPLVRIGDLYLHERMLLIADTVRQEASDAVRIYTTIIEVDPATKHPRNKIINFVRARDPREYAQARAWLDSLAGMPQAADDTALELAAELERKLNAAKGEIAELKAKIESIRGMLRGDV